MRFLSFVLLFICLFVIAAPPAFAHVVVRPNEVSVAQRTNFAVSVPTEEKSPTVNVRVVIPEGVRSVRPNVKPGWEIEIVRSGEGEEERISEIIWSGGKIPADQRDEFVFSAQAPAEETTLAWKAYQTYDDGKIVAWEADPKDPKASHPYSETKVINDTAAEVQPTSGSQSAVQGVNNNGLLMAAVLASLVMSGASLWLQLRRK